MLFDPIGKAVGRQIQPDVVLEKRLEARKHP